MMARISTYQLQCEELWNSNTGSVRDTLFKFNIYGHDKLHAENDL